MSDQRVPIWIVLLAGLALIGATLACGQQSGETTTPQVVVATPTTSSAAPPQEEPPVPTSTPVPGGCADGMQFVTDVTVPDGTVFGPNESFVKTWRVRNSGSCNWSGYRLIFDHGEPMGTLEQSIPDLPAGEEIDISVEMTAPGGTGGYRGYWRVESPAGANLGTIFCDIVVADAGSTGGTEEPTEEPTEEATTAPAAGAPAAPSHQRLGGGGDCTVTLAWDDNSDDEDGFRIRHVGVGWLDPVGANVTQATVPLPPCGETYQYRVRAFNGAGDSDPSNTLDVAGVCQSPNLVIVEAHFEPDPVVQGQDFDACFTVRNDGTVASGPFSIVWHFHPNLGLDDCRLQNPGLGPGEESSGRCTRNTAAAAHGYHTDLTVDAGGTVDESDEGDNTLNIPLRVQAQ